MPMVAGVIKRARNSGDLASITSHVVRKNDIYSRKMGDHEEIVHDLPVEGTDRGEIVAAYAIAHLRDGSIEREWMTFDDIEKRRKCSKSGGGANPTGVWAQWYEEMAQKTVLHRLCRRLPMSPDVERVVQRIEDEYDFTRPEPEPVPAVVEQPEGEETVAARKVRLAAAKKAAKKRAEPEVPEVVEEEPPVHDEDHIPFEAPGDGEPPI